MELNDHIGPRNIMHDYNSRWDMGSSKDGADRELERILEDDVLFAGEADDGDVPHWWLEEGGVEELEDV